MSGIDNKTEGSGSLHGLVSRPYSDWFGQGDTKDDVMGVVKQHGEPLEVLLEESGYMACVIYADRVVVVGYDGNEYCHTFEFPRTQAANGDLDRWREASRNDRDWNDVCRNDFRL